MSNAARAQHAAKVLASMLESSIAPVVSRYDIGQLLYAISQRKDSESGGSIGRLDQLSPKAVDAALDQLGRDALLTPHRSFPPGSVYTVFGRSKSPQEDVACSVDPFAYVSHLGAMEFHGLTERIPRILFLTTPSSKTWKVFAQQKMESDFGVDLAAVFEKRLPRLMEIPFHEISARPVHIHRSLHLGAFRTFKERPMRVATIGRTFLDMIRNADLCGKMEHVLDAYQQHAKRYLRLICDEIERYGTGIDKVRAGYILEERCGLRDPVIESWTAFVQRGGSRKLDPMGDYSSTFSERWSLSINAAIGND